MRVLEERMKHGKLRGARQARQPPRTLQAAGAAQAGDMRRHVQPSDGRPTEAMLRSPSAEPRARRPERAGGTANGAVTGTRRRAPLGGRGRGGRGRGKAQGRRGSRASGAAADQARSEQIRPSQADGDELTGGGARYSQSLKAGMAGGRIRLAGSKSNRSRSKRETLRLAVWNSWGLSVETLDYIVGSQDGSSDGLGYDIVGLVELHGDEQERKKLWGSNRLQVGAPPVRDESGKKTDPASGVALLLSARAARAMLRCVSVSTRIMWAEFSGERNSVVTVVAYAPHIGWGNQAVDAFWEELRVAWRSLPENAAKILMLDANGALGRSTGGVTGPWSLYKTDNEMGAKLRRFCEEQDLVVSSTYFTPRQKRGGASTFWPFGNGETGKKPRQLDYFCTERRWRTCVQNVQRRWSSSQQRWDESTAVKKDHGMLVVDWRMKIRNATRVPQPDLDALKTADGAKLAAEEWERQWKATAARFLIPEIEEVPLPPNRRHNVLGLEELGIRVEGVAEGMTLDVAAGMSAEVGGGGDDTPPVDSVSDPVQLLDRKVGRWISCVRAVVAALPKREVTHQARYFSLSEETRQMKAAEQQAAEERSRRGVRQTREERLAYNRRHSAQRRKDYRSCHCQMRACSCAVQRAVRYLA